MSDVPYPDRHIGVFEIGDVKPTAEGGSQKVKVKVRINPNGIFGVSSANLVEKHEIEEEVPEDAPMETDDKKEEGADKKEENKDEAKPADGEAKPEEKMETGEAKPEEKKEVKMVKRKKVVNKNIDLPISQRVNGQLSYERLQSAVSSDLVCIISTMT